MGAVIQETLRLIEPGIVSNGGSIDLFGQTFRPQELLNAGEFCNRQRAFQRIITTRVEEGDDRWPHLRMPDSGHDGMAVAAVDPEMADC